MLPVPSANPARAGPYCVWPRWSWADGEALLVSSGAISQTGTLGAHAGPRAPVAASGPGTPEPRAWGLITPTGLVMAGALAILFCGLFYHFLWSQHLNSWGNGDWSHSYLVPVISVYILWQRRAELSALPARTFWPGLIPLLVAIPIYGVSQVRAVPGTHMIQGWSMVLALFGLVLLLCGPRIARVAFIPIAYLLFAVTISEMIMLTVTAYLKTVASQGAWVTLNLIGVRTDVSGNVLEVFDSAGKGHQLDVAEACSGMRMVIAFLALGVAVAIVGVRHWWQRVLLVVLALPVALFMNIIRVAVLGVLTLVNPELSAGESHMLIGTILLVPAFLLYMLIVWCLHKLVQDPPAPVYKAPAPAPWRIRWDRFATRPFVTAAVVMLVGIVGVNGALAVMGAHLRKLPIQAEGNRQVSAIPAETASFRRVGSDEQMKAEMVEELGTKNYLSRVYVRKDTPAGERPVRLDVHLAYYTGMIDTVPHVQERCMVGAGWNLVGDSRVMPLTLNRASRWTPELDAQGNPTGQMRARLDMAYGDAKDAKSDRVRLPRSPEQVSMMVSEFSGPRGLRQFGGYFFIANGGHVARAEGVRMLAFDLRATYAFYLKVQVSSFDVQSREELVEHASALIDELLPEIMRCVPDWAEVEAGRYPPDNPARERAQPTK